MFFLSAQKGRPPEINDFRGSLVAGVGLSPSNDTKDIKLEL